MSFFHSSPSFWTVLPSSVFQSASLYLFWRPAALSFTTRLVSFCVPRYSSFCAGIFMGNSPGQQPNVS